MDVASAVRWVAITDDGGVTLEERLARARAALESRPTALLVRERGAAAEDVAALLRALRGACDEAGVRLLANATMLARGKWAEESLALVDGVHFGDATAGELSRIREAHPRLMLGYSAHSAAEAIRVLAQGADYVTLSPLFETASKRGVLAALGVAGFREAAAQIRAERPAAVVVALGGIENADHARAARDAGASGVAAIRAAALGAAGPGAAMRAVFDGA